MSQTYPVKITEGGILYLEMPEELSILEDFMIVDLNLKNIQEYLNIIDKALNEEKSQKISGNTTALSIQKDKTMVYNTSIDQECTLDTEDIKEILKVYLKESLLLTIENDIKKMNAIYEKTKTVNSISDILKIQEDLKQDKII